MKNEIVELSFNFALNIIELYKFLKNNNEFVLSKQVLRSGTSIGANISEAQAAQSKRDFISKMSISLKEAWETRYWIKLLEKSNYLLGYNNLSIIKNEIESIINILTKIIKTSKEVRN